MTSLELYEKFHLLLNSNHLFQNVRIEKPNFVSLYNREKDRWMAQSISEYGDNDRIFDLQSHYVSSYKLEEFSITSNKALYRLPDNYFAYASCYSNCTKNGKTNRVVNYFTKPKDELELLVDEFNSPSFEFEESICNITDNKLLVFFDDYTIINTYLSYYKEIAHIDIKGYRKIDGTLSSDKNPDIADFYLEQILDRMVTEVMREYQNSAGVQIGRDREKINL